MKTGPVYRQHGFSLIEVMVALIVLSVGLLGIAKIQAVALSSTTTASQRSLAAIEAASLAAMMHVNRGYWNQATPTTNITVQGTTVTSGPSAASSSCLVKVVPTVPPCAPAGLAAYDLQDWANDVNAVLPNASTTITCTTAGITQPSCTILITWSEKSVALNSQAQGQATDTNVAINKPDYTLYVEP